MESGSAMRVLAPFLAAFLAAGTAAGQTWRSMGPPGGDARTLAVDPANPSVVYLGTTDGHLFGSQDAGRHWEILGRAGGLQSVITSIVVSRQDSSVLYASAWSRSLDGEGAGIFSSGDSGRHWRTIGLARRHVRALVQAPSNPRILIAGALDGVYRSNDSGASWQRISPPGDEELRNLDSLAIDPSNPSVIYAGTFHLPWKTTDGGRHWAAIHSGMIDDSDVLSMIVDSGHARRIFASACSGIYRSDSAGSSWKKIQGIPFSARRTNVIRQDPVHPATIYAGTTEGLWRTEDAGERWQRVSPHDWVINALALAQTPQGQRLLVGTQQLGVLSSDDGGAHFRAANNGFNHREIVSLALDPLQPGRVLAVLANAPEPALATADGGRTWVPLGGGLRAEGLKRVYASPVTWWAALERGGLMRYDAAKAIWNRAGLILGEGSSSPPGTKPRTANATPANRRAINSSGASAPWPSSGSKNGRGETQLPLGQSSSPALRGSADAKPFDLVVNDMAFSRDAWFVATEAGLFASRDQGLTWSRFPFAPLPLPVSSVRVSSDGRTLRVVSLRGMVFSFDRGQNWMWHDLPFDSGGALWLDAADDWTLLATARKGLYISRDAGITWQKQGAGLPEAPVQDLALEGSVWLASMQTGGLYVSYDRGVSWSRVAGTLAEGFFPVVTTPESGDVIYAASSSEGLYAVELAPHSAASAPAGH